MKHLLLHFSVSLLNNFIEIRTFFWKFRKIFSKSIVLKLSKVDEFKFMTDGELVGIIYANQPKIFWDKGFEHSTVRLMKQEVKEGMIVFDVGANIGMYSLLLSKLVGPKGKVYAFEPDFKTFEILQKNIELSGFNNIEAVQLALSDSESFVTLSKSKNLGDAFHYIVNVEPGLQDTGVIKTSTLDDFIKTKNINEVGFIKIDIEGAELLCLKGARKLLVNYKPLIVSECFEDYLDRFGNSVADIILLMEECGYQSKNYDFQQWVFRKRSC